MIYVGKKMLSAKAASDQLAISKGSHQEFDVSCDANAASKCRKKYRMSYREFVKVCERNDGKLLCIFCSRKIKFSGRNNPNTKYKSLNDSFFRVIDTEEKAYLLGWIASDGTIDSRGFTIAIHQNDIETLKILRNIICDEIPLRSFTTPTSRLVSFSVSSKEISKDVCRWLKMVAGPKFDIVKFPDLQNDFLRWAFLRGYFEGDGTINKFDATKKYQYPKAAIASSSIDMLKFIKTFCNINCSISRYRSKYIYKKNKNRKTNFQMQLSWHGKSALAFLNKIYESQSLQPRLKRKFELFVYWKNK